MEIAIAIYDSSDSLLTKTHRKCCGLYAYAHYGERIANSSEQIIDGRQTIIRKSNGEKVGKNDETKLQAETRPLGSVHLISYLLYM